MYMYGNVCIWIIFEFWGIEFAFFLGRRGGWLDVVQLFGFLAFWPFFGFNLVFGFGLYGGWD